MLRITSEEKHHNTILTALDNIKTSSPEERQKIDALREFLGKSTIFSLNINTVIPGCHFLFRSEHDGTLLHWATTNGYGDLIDTLLNLGASPNIPDKSGFTALQRFLGSTKANQLLITPERLRLFFKDKKNGPDINDKLFEETDTTLLHWAMKKGSAKIINEVLKLGASQHTVDKQNKTPLYYLESSNTYRHGTYDQHGSNILMYRSLQSENLIPKKEGLKENLLKIIQSYEFKTERRDLFGKIKSEMERINESSPENFLEVIIAFYFPVKQIYNNKILNGTLMDCLEELANGVFNSMNTEELNSVQQKLTTAMQELKFDENKHKNTKSEILFYGYRLVDNILKNQLKIRTQKTGFFSKSSDSTIDGERKSLEKENNSVDQNSPPSSSPLSTLTGFMARTKIMAASLFNRSGNNQSINGDGPVSVPRNPFIDNTL